MSWLLLLSLSSAVAQDEAPEPEVAADTADTGAMADDGVDVLVAEQELIEDFGRLGDERFALLAAKKRENQRKAAEARRLKKIKDQTAKAMAVVALLLLWLLTRKQNERGAVRVPTRHAPTTPDELSHLLFQAVLDADLDTYRVLHLTGGEASRLLGQLEAERYLSQRSVRVLEDALVELAIRVPPGATLVGAVENAGRLTLQVRFDGRTENVSAGTVRQVGNIWRLYEVPAHAEPPSFSGSFS